MAFEYISAYTAVVKRLLQNHKNTTDDMLVVIILKCCVKTKELGTSQTDFIMPKTPNGNVNRDYWS